MLGISLPQFIVILFVGIMVVGPQRMPEIMRTAGRAIAELKKHIHGLRTELRESTALEEIRALRAELQKQIIEAETANRKKEE